MLIYLMAIFLNIDLSLQSYFKIWYKIQKAILWRSFYEKIFSGDALLVSSDQILACDYYEDEKVLKEVVETGTYKSKDTTGKLCSNDKRNVMPIKNGKPEGFAKEYYESGALEAEINFKNGKMEGLKWYYESGILKAKVKFKNGKEEWVKYYDRFGNVEYERKQK